MEFDKAVHDVLIVGAGMHTLRLCLSLLAYLFVSPGPAGLTAAVMLNRMGIKPLLIDAGTYVDHEWGRAEVLHSRYIGVSVRYH